MPDIKPGLSDLRKFRPLNMLSESQLVLLAAKSQIKKMAAGEVLVEIDSQDYLEYFLLKGGVALESFDGRHSEIEAESEKAEAAIALLQPRKYTVTTKTPCAFLVIEQQVLKALLSEVPQQKTVVFSASDLNSGKEISSILSAIEDDLRTNNLELPTLPMVALGIRHAIAEGHASTQELASILNSDPAMAVKLLRACNSPLYRGVNEVSSCKDAIVRLGLDTTQKLINIFALRELFRSNNEALKNRMNQIWEYSRDVAAIACSLADITPSLDREQAMLAGLIHNIGAIPVLNYIEHQPQALRFEFKIDEIVQKVSRQVGMTILNSWGFQQDFIDVVAHSEMWGFDSGSELPTYSDVILVAQIHALIGTPQQKSLPPFDTIPAFRKLGDGGLTPEKSQQVISQAHHQIEEAKALMGA